MTEARRDELKQYRRRWMRDYRTRLRAAWATAHPLEHAAQEAARAAQVVQQQHDLADGRGRCPYCTMLLSSEYHQPALQLQTFGRFCPYWSIHMRLVITTVAVFNEQNG